MSKKPQLPTPPSLEKIINDLDRYDTSKKNDLQFQSYLNINKEKNENENNSDNNNKSLNTKYEQSKNYIQFIMEIQNYYSLSNNNNQLEVLLKNINSLKYYIDILKNLSNINK